MILTHDMKIPQDVWPVSKSKSTSGRGLCNPKEGWLDQKSGFFDNLPLCLVSNLHLNAKNWQKCMEWTACKISG